VTALLVVLAVGFAYSMGAHYTGACMGMPHALSAISARRALLLMAPLTLIGATFASHGVEHTVGHNLLTGAGLSVDGLIIVIGIAFGLTSTFNKARIPTSTIQILVFTVVGAGLAAGIGVHWSTIATLAAIWVAAPLVAGGAGYPLTEILDQMPAVRIEARAVDQALADTGRPRRRPHPDKRWETLPLRRHQPPARPAGGWLARSSPSGRSPASPWAATTSPTPPARSWAPTPSARSSPVCWAGPGSPSGCSPGVGRCSTASPSTSSPSTVPAGVVLAAVGFGFFTSMNQALVGAMTGTAAARGRHTVHAVTLLGILRGWAIGPGAGIALAYAITRLVVATAGVHTLLAGH
jgi:PiT family inorganic phosphate transporter